MSGEDISFASGAVRGIVEAKSALCHLWQTSGNVLHRGTFLACQNTLSALLSDCPKCDGTGYPHGGGREQALESVSEQCGACAGVGQVLAREGEGAT